MRGEGRGVNLSWRITRSRSEGGGQQQKNSKLNKRAKQNSKLNKTAN